MNKPLLQFSHANGFPASCYQALLQPLQKQFDIHYIEMLGHDTRYPVTDNWAALVDELIASIENPGHQPVIGLGHSLGAALTFFAAVKRPDLFKAIILLDAPMLVYPKALVIRWFKAWGKVDWITPGRRAQRRREVWRDFAEAKHYFKSRGLFKDFDEACLEDYLNFGLFQENNQNLRLKFKASIEALIYGTLPDNYHDYKQQLKVPAYMLAGVNSDIVRPIDLWSIERNFNIQCKQVQGGHLFPFEHPRNTAMEVLKIFDELH